jgi:hypothetical protein
MTVEAQLAVEVKKTSSISMGLEGWIAALQREWHWAAREAVRIQGRQGTDGQLFHIKVESGLGQNRANQRDSHARPGTTKIRKAQFKVRVMPGLTRRQGTPRSEVMGLRHKLP